MVVGQARGAIYTIDSTSAVCRYVAQSHRRVGAERFALEVATNALTTFRFPLISQQVRLRLKGYYDSLHAYHQRLCVACHEVWPTDEAPSVSDDDPTLPNDPLQAEYTCKRYVMYLLFNIEVITYSGHT